MLTIHHYGIVINSGEILALQWQLDQVFLSTSHWPTYKSFFLKLFLLQREDETQNLVDIVDFALTLRDKLESINQESFNNFVLRVGKLNGNTNVIRQRGQRKGDFY